jgi:multiple sugar transport system substrate-binding protein
MKTSKTSTRAVALAAAALAIGLHVGTAQAQGTLLWSTQASPVAEQKAMREQVLKDAPLPVEFLSNQEGPFLTRLNAELQAGKGSIAVVGALHGTLATAGAQMVDLSAQAKGLSLSPAFVSLGKLGTGEQKYLPWMQATFVMAAHKKALPYLPAGADLQRLTYDQLVAWSKNLAEQTGGPKFGFPAGPQGLKHRFFQGYLYPSYANSMVTEFRSAGAEKGWEMMRELWKYTHSASTSYNFMQEPLLSGQVWVAFDHIARLANAFNEKPEDFVAFPAPSGPTGRGFMPVLAGLAIPRTVPDRAAAEKVIAYLMRPEVQVATLKATNFFPTVDVKIPADMPPSVAITAKAIQAQSGAPDANPGLLPVGLGALGGKFNQVYVDTFERVVLARQPIRPVLDEQASVLRKIMQDAKAPCWEPDQPSQGACPVK